MSALANIIRSIGQAGLFSFAVLRASSPAEGIDLARQMVDVDGLKKLGARLEKVADDVTDRVVGDRVVATSSHGSHAELFAVSARTTWKVPEGADIAAAACVPVAYGTAHDCLFEFGRLTDGEKSVGEFMAFFTAMSLAFEPLRRLAGMSGMWSQAAASVERLRAMLDLAPAALPPRGTMQDPAVHRAEGERR